MNKSVVWIIAILIILGLGYFLLGSSDDSNYDSEDAGVNLEDADDSAFENVESTDQILNEITDSLNYLG